MLVLAPVWAWADPRIDWIICITFKAEEDEDDEEEGVDVANKEARDGAGAEGAAVVTAGELVIVTLVALEVDFLGESSSSLEYQLSSSSIR